MVFDRGVSIVATGGITGTGVGNVFPGTVFWGAVDVAGGAIGGAADGVWDVVGGAVVAGGVAARGTVVLAGGNSRRVIPEPPNGVR